MTERDEGQSQSLFDLINQSTYQPSGVTGDADVTQGADSTPGATGNEGLSPAVRDASVTPQGASPDPGLTTGGQSDPSGQFPPQPPVDPRLQQMEETIVNQARYIQNVQQQAARAQQMQQEREFQAKLADMDPGEREVAIRDRELTRLRQRNQQLEQQSHMSEAQKQEFAKNQLSLHVAMEQGLPIEMAPALLAANSLQDMEERARGLVNTLNTYYQPIQQAQPAQPQAPQQNPAAPANPNAAFASGGEGGGSDTTVEIERGSGDLLGLIGQQSYQRVAGW